jgi:hypothetical protein
LEIVNVASYFLYTYKPLYKIFTNSNEIRCVHIWSFQPTPQGS